MRPFLLEHYTKRIILPLLFCFNLLTIIAQTSTNSTKDQKNRFSLKVLKDSLDGKLDMSDALIDYKGFIPVPQIVTEPAMGGFGLMLTPVFIRPNKVQVEGKYIPPNITAGFIGYTANKTWGFGGVRIASLPKYHLKYRVGAVYGDVNMDFYRDMPIVGEQEFSFNFRIVGVFASVLREVGNTDLYLGLEYFYGKNEISPEFEHIVLPDFVKEKDLNSNISSIGLNLEYDKRDNVFTPDSGWYITSEFRVNADWTGSDYNFQNFNLGFIKYFQVSPKWVSGLRLDTQFQCGDAPFYLMPSVSLRGVPMSRYQGDQTYVLETEQRYDFAFRWSAIGFVGLAKAPTKKVSFNDAELINNYGGGFRYLIARKFKIRTGVDVAWANGDFGWYIVFGCSWNNRN